MIEKLEDIIIRLNNLNTAGRYAEVLAELQPLMNEDDNVAAFYIIKGNAQYGQGLFEEAAQSYATAVAVNPDDAAARSNYGSTLYGLGHYVDGLNACDAALLIDKTFVPAYINAAHCLIGLELYEKAADYLQRAADIHPSDAMTRIQIAEIFADTGGYELARDQYLSVARLPNAPADIHERIASFFRQAREDGVDRNVLIQDIGAWRNEFVKNPEVFRLASSLL